MTISIENIAINIKDRESEREKKENAEFMLALNLQEPLHIPAIKCIM